MSEEKFAEESEHEEKWETRPVKPARKRKKGLYSLIRQQMEFYFSDSNLAKDKFLTSLIFQSNEGYIDLAVFLNFNKIRALTTDTEDIRKALVSSEILKISEDSKHVKRITRIQPLENVDDCTLYLENLPTHATHDWIREIFSPFGKINYVSLPRLKASKKIKGFAFVEFNNPESVESACQYFNGSSGSKASPTFKDDGCKKITSGDSETSSSAKRRLEAVETNEGEVKEGQPRKRLKKDDDPSSENVEGEGVELVKEKKVKHRKHKKKHKERNEADTLHLLVMSKLEWKRLRNKYLALQKANMAEVKKYLGLLNESDHSLKAKGCSADVPAPLPTSNAPEFKPGVIIKITAEKPFVNAKKMRTEMKTLPGVAYIELEDDTFEAYIRCIQPEDTSQVLKSVEHHGQAVILQDTEEKEYWERIVVKRDATYAARSKPKQRGCNKIIQKAVKNMEISNKHVRFDD